MMVSTTPMTGTRRMNSMARGEDGGGFGWGLVLGGLIGVVVGAYIASGPGREQVDGLRSRTVELTERRGELKERARSAADRARNAIEESDHPLSRAVQDGVVAARRRRRQLATEETPGE